MTTTNKVTLGLGTLVIVVAVLITIFTTLQATNRLDIHEVQESTTENKVEIGKMQEVDKNLKEGLERIEADQRVIRTDVREIKTMIIERLPK